MIRQIISSSTLIANFIKFVFTPIFISIFFPIYTHATLEYELKTTSAWMQLLPKISDKDKFWQLYIRDIDLIRIVTRSHNAVSPELPTTKLNDFDTLFWGMPFSEEMNRLGKLIPINTPWHSIVSGLLFFKEGEEANRIKKQYSQEIESVFKLLHTSQSSKSEELLTLHIDKTAFIFWRAQKTVDLIAQEAFPKTHSNIDNHIKTFAYLDARDTFVSPKNRVIITNNEHDKLLVLCGNFQTLSNTYQENNDHREIFLYELIREALRKTLIEPFIYMLTDESSLFHPKNTEEEEKEKLLTEFTQTILTAFDLTRKVYELYDIRHSVSPYFSKTVYTPCKLEELLKLFKEKPCYLHTFLSSFYDIDYVKNWIKHHRQKLMIKTRGKSRY